MNRKVLKTKSHQNLRNMNRIVHLDLVSHSWCWHHQVHSQNLTTMIHHCHTTLYVEIHTATLYKFLFLVTKTGVGHTSLTKHWKVCTEQRISLLHNFSDFSHKHAIVVKITKIQWQKYFFPQKKVWGEVPGHAICRGWMQKMTNFPVLFAIEIFMV